MKKVLVLAASVLVLSVANHTTAWAKASATAGQIDVIEPALTVTEAIKKAKAVDKGGKVISVYMDVQLETPIYIVDTESKLSSATYIVDGMNGDILASSVTRSHEYEWKDFMLDIAVPDEVSVEYADAEFIEIDEDFSCVIDVIE